MSVFLGALYCLVFSECKNEVEMMIFVAWSLLRVSCQNEQCFWVVLAPNMSIKQPTVKCRRVPKPKNDYIFGNGFLQHIFWCRGHIFLGVVCIDEKWWVLSLNAGKGRVYREESPISVGILTVLVTRLLGCQSISTLSSDRTLDHSPLGGREHCQPRLRCAGS